MRGSRALEGLPPCREQRGLAEVETLGAHLNEGVIEEVQKGDCHIAALGPVVVGTSLDSPLRDGGTSTMDGSGSLPTRRS
jgi:hypothetical protein